MSARPTPEKASFRINRDSGTRVSFEVKGSAVHGIVEAFGWLDPKRRDALLECLKQDHVRLLADEAARGK